MTIRTRAEAAHLAEAARTNKPGTCQAWTRALYGAPAAGDRDHDGDADAVDGWLSEPPAHRRPGDKNPPRGVPVAWAGGSKGFGHRAIALGDGLIRSIDMRDGRYKAGVVGTATIDQISRAMGLTYLGWSPTITGILIPGAPTAAPTPPAKLQRPEEIRAAIQSLKQRLEKAGPRESEKIRVAIAELKKIAKR